MTGVTGTTAWQPVVVGSEVIAVLCVSWPHPVDEQDPALRAVRVLAAEAGAALHAVQLRAELERFAMTDPLTGALNRRAWEARLTALTDRARSTSGSLTIALVDLDHFKVYNDTFGHSAGDILLREFAAAVSRTLRPTDLFARWGGEEFILALSDCDPEQAAALLHRVRESVPDRQSASIGHTTWRPTESVGTCISRADSALYRAKEQGRNRLVAG